MTAPSARCIIIDKEDASIVVAGADSFSEFPRLEMSELFRDYRYANYIKNII